MIYGYKDVKHIAELQPGDILRHKAGDKSFVVTENYGTRVTAVRTVDVTNACEWEKLHLIEYPELSDGNTGNSD